MRFNIAFYILFILIAFATTCVPETFAAENKFCSSLFESQNETQHELSKLDFTGSIFSPIIEKQGKLAIADYQILNESKNLGVGELASGFMWEPQYNYNDIGFLPNPEEYAYRAMYLRYTWGLDGFANAFGDRTNPEEKNAILEVDKQMLTHFIESHRLGHAGVSKADAPKNKVYSAFIRVYDGTDYASLGHPTSIKNRSFYSYKLPSEISFSKNGTKSEVFENLRKQGYQIFQVGKYFFDSTLSPVEKKAARREILGWLLRNYLDPKKMLSEKVMFIFNVDSLRHQRTYRRFFKTKKVDPNLFDPPIKEPNAILMVDLQTLKQQIEKYLAESDDLQDLND